MRVFVVFRRLWARRERNGDRTVPGSVLECNSYFYVDFRQRWFILYISMQAMRVLQNAQLHLCAAMQYVNTWAAAGVFTHKPLCRGSMFSHINTHGLVEVSFDFEILSNTLHNWNYWTNTLICSHALSFWRYAVAYLFSRHSSDVCIPYFTPGVVRVCV